ncbi:hypothetical protein N7455_001695 [Penicillium solitum]|uniref:chanoclavine-I aldehyde reductase n=1 Tax=Penicillium nordicum TaxID=229535 RepID=A0A0M9WC99_9EURO|nr:hypothetical protein DTO002I6_388 [Penicillium roqueforti]KAJ5695402.1 hypothetical protein N7536_005814 [Penicillium majusculum]KAJ5878230.1 hypothetical protein N7455_001695 [Penicillium solitum]KOS39225.1 hypothetical protein ACN38_g9946 [Penicillium nordicum]
MSKLFEPLNIVHKDLKHRIVMAPLTRFRASDDHIQLPMTVEYYSQRASVPGTLIITEATIISPSHGGVPNAPGIWNDAQIEAWKKVVDAVHARGCFINCQLWAPGRAADKATLLKEAGHGLLSASPVSLTDCACQPQAMSESQIQDAVQDYAQAARNAMKAGFDGVEIHGANGYLLDQFLQNTSNQREDAYGGSVENRARFPLAVAEGVVRAIGPDKIGYRISPWSSFQGMRMGHPIPQFSYLVENLKTLKLGYLHVIESRVHNNVDVEKTEGIEFALDIWGKTSPVLVAGGFTPKSAKYAVDQEYPNNDIGVVFGRSFLANPDLPFRIEHDLDLTKYDRSSFYAPKQAEGYTDYPFSKEFLVSVSG